MANKKAKIDTLEARSFDMGHFGIPTELGFSEQELLDIGGMDPIAAAEVTFESSSPVAGWLIGEKEMPPRMSIDPARRARGEKEDWSALIVLLTASTNAYVGEEVVEVEAGRRVIIPVGGNLGNNMELLQKAHDPKFCFWVFIDCNGQVQLDKQRNPMWNYTVKCSPKGKARESEGSLSLPRPRNLPRLTTPNGTVPGQVVSRDGQPVQSLVG